jgi:vitamin B12 transporter
MRIKSRAFSSFLRSLLIPTAIVALIALPATPAAAQEPQVLPGIVVQGATLEKRPQKPPASTPATSPGSSATNSGDGSGGTGAQASADTEADGVPAESVGTALTVVTGEQLRRQQVREVADALRSLPGVSVSQTGGTASLTQVRIRGAEANHTLVLIDGVEANAGTDGEFDFSDLLVEDIERIEVLRGPQSALYGSNAVGGVINIITKSGRGPWRASVRAEGGSFGTHDEAASISGGTDRAWGSISVQNHGTKGFNIAPDGPLGEKDGSRVTQFAAKAGFQLADNVRLTLSIRDTEKHGDRDDQTGLNGRGSGCRPNPINDIQPCYIIASDSFSHFASSVLLMGANLQWDTLGGDLTHVFKVTGNITERDDVQIANFNFPPLSPSYSPSPFNNHEETYKFGYQSTYRFATPAFLGAHYSVTGLVEHQWQSFDTDSLFGGSVSAQREQTSFAGEWRGDFLNRVFLSASVRHDDNDTFKDFTTWRSGISIPIKELGLRPHASVGTAVKMPTLFEQFGSTSNFVSNSGLKPEESFGWDAGVEATFLKGKAVVDVTYFSSDLTNKISTVFVSATDPGRPVDCKPGDLFCAFPVNLAGVSERRGVEISGRFQVMPNVLLGLAYTYLDAVDSTGKQEIRRPPHSARADVTYLFDDGRGTLNLAAAYNGEMKDTVFGAPFFFPVTDITLKDYWLVTASASYKLQPGVEIYGRVENLLNQHYEEVFGFATAGVAAYAGVRLTLDQRSYEALEKK